MVGPTQMAAKMGYVCNFAAVLPPRVIFSFILLWRFWLIIEFLIDTFVQTWIRSRETFFASHMHNYDDDKRSGSDDGRSSVIHYNKYQPTRYNNQYPHHQPSTITTHNFLSLYIISAQRDHASWFHRLSWSWKPSGLLHTDPRDWLTCVSQDQPCRLTLSPTYPNNLSVCLLYNIPALYPIIPRQKHFTVLNRSLLLVHHTTKHIIGVGGRFTP